MMHLTLVIISSVFVYLDNVKFVTKGTKNDCLDKLTEVMKVLDEADLQLKTRNCVFA